MELSKKVLVVDDEPLILYGLLKGLRNEKTEVKTVGTGEEAIHAIKSGFYDLCFLDIYLPDLNGLEVLKKIKEISPKTTVAMMSASHLDEETKKKLEDGAVLFIPKPFELFQIKSIAKWVLE